jgi:diguanylate cyclase (GGDEF)-like protein/PAS domain S-box-containing protein
METMPADAKTRAELLAEVDALRQRLTALAQADAEYRQAIDILRASKEKYRILLDESSDPIFTFCPDGQYQYVNRAFADGVGKKLEDIIGKRIWDVFPQAEADKRFAVVKWVFENGKSREIEVRVPRPDGDRYYLTTAKPILDEKQRTTSVICISKEITERKAMEDQLARMAQYDTLTDLPNRALFSDRLRHAIAQARRDKTRLALMFVDLDKFKPVNDNFGHHVGDLLLQVVARRMQYCIRESDTVGRIGGDEFVVLLPAIEAAADALLVAEKIRASLAQPFDLPGYERQNISASIGIALYPDHGNDEVGLAKNADDAMYRAKTGGRNLVQIFQPA